MAEWSMAVVLKTIEPERVPGVRIPLPPPASLRSAGRRTLAAALTCVGMLVLARPASAACSGSGLSWVCTAGTSQGQVSSTLGRAADGATLTFKAGSYKWDGSPID